VENAQAVTQRAPKKEIFGWAMFDFANSSYVTIIITVVFAPLFTKTIVGPEIGAAPDHEFDNANFLWSITQAVSFAAVVLTAPVLGAMADFTATKKKFLFYSYLITILACCGLYFVNPGAVMLAMVLVALSNFGFASGENIVSSFLPGLGPAKDLGKISGYAWGLGYFGGILSTLVLMQLIKAPEGGGLGDQVYIGPFTGLFFLVAAIPTFLWVKERGRSRVMPAGENILTIGFKRLSRTFREIRKFHDLTLFLLSLFFGMGGLIICGGLAAAFLVDEIGC